MLIIDGRPRWETRYLRNLFQRDERWQVSLTVAGPGAAEDSLPRGEGEDVFPEDKRTLFARDLGWSWAKSPSISSSRKNSNG